MADPTGILINIAIQAAIGLALSLLTPRQRNEGPRIEDRQVTTSTYGNFHELGYGTTVMLGNIIWGVDLIEDKLTERSGGKGGPRIENVTYRYYGTFAVALAGREISDVLRIYADGKLIYDREVSADAPAEYKQDLIDDLDFNLYRGTQTQGRDPIIASYEGEANTPAYRGTAYIVFNRLPLEKFGNRIPTLKFVVRFAPDPGLGRLSIKHKASWQNTINYDLISETDNARHVFDPYEKFLIAQYWGSPGAGSLSNRWYAVINPYTGEPLMERSFTEISLSTGDHFLRARGPWMCVGNSFSTSGVEWHLIETETLEVIDTSNTSSNRPGSMTRQPTGSDPIGCYLMAGIKDATIVEVLAANGGRSYFLAVGGNGDNGFHPGARWGVARLTKSDGFTFVEGSGSVAVLNRVFPSGWDSIDRVCQGYQHVSWTDVYILYEWSAATIGFDAQQLRKRIVKHKIGDGIDYIGDIEEVFPTSWFYEIPQGEGNTLCTMVYDPVSDRLLVGVGSGIIYCFDCDSTNKFGFPKFRWKQTDVPWDHRIKQWQNVQDVEPMPYGYFYRPGRSDRHLYKVSISTGAVIEVLENVLGPDAFPTGDNVDFFPDPFTTWFTPDYEADALHSFYLSGYLRPPLRRASERLDTVVSDICLRSRLTADDIDVTGLVSKEVAGYTVQRQTTFRAALEPLASAYNFHAVEKDGKLFFELRDGETDAVVINDDLIQSGDRVVLEETRGQDLETPRAVYIKHLSPDSDDKVMVQGARRIGTISPTVNSVGEQTIEVPLYLTADEGAAMAERLLFESWLQREGLRFRLPQAFLPLIVNDVLQVTAEERIENIRINRLSVGADLTLELEGSVIDGSVYTAALPGVEFRNPTGYNPGKVTLEAARIRGWHLDIPLPRDGDLGNDRTQTVMYFVAAPSPLDPRAFPGATLQTAFSGAEYAQRASINVAVPWATVIDMPDMPSYDFNAVQEASITVRVHERADEFASVTEEAMITQSANFALILKANGEAEFIHFRDVIENANGTMTLTGLIRGVRGTVHGARSYSTYTGQVSLFLLDPAWMTGYAETLARLGATMTWRAVPSILSAPAIVSEDKTLIHAALKPLAPANVRMSIVGGNRVISWNRRTRVNGQWNNINEVPLSEDSEAYEVDILSGPGGVVLRTLTTTTKSVTYTEAQADVDFGTDYPNPLYVRVYQMSAEVGRGFSYERALTET